MKLNEQQEAVAEHHFGPCLVISVPGSGKTSTLVERVCRLIQRGADPRKILCITFTNKAANEFKERLAKRLNVKKPPMFVGTFHALCAMILRRFGDRIGYSKSFSIIDSDDQKDLLKKIVRLYETESSTASGDGDDLNVGIMAYHINFARENFESYNELMDRIDNAFPDHPLAWDIARTYLEELPKHNSIDFSGLLYECIRLLQEDEEVRGIIQKRFDFIQVDEVQDTNHAQFTFLELLSQKHKNLLMVGDISQSIFAFRGSRYQNIQDFLHKHPNCTQIPLSKNYRSTPEIIYHADRLIRKNTSHMDVPFLTDNPSGAKPVCEDFMNSYKEAAWIADKIQYYIEQEGWDANDIAIFYRLNKLSMEVQMALTTRNIPFIVIGGRSFFDKKEIKDCLAMLKVKVNPYDSIAFHRVADRIKGVGNATIGKLEQRAKKDGKSVVEVAKLIASDSAGYESESARLKSFAKKVDNIWGFDHSNMTPSDAIDKLVKNIEYDEYLDRKFGKDSLEKMDNIEQLVGHAETVAEKGVSIEKYVQNITLMSSSDKASEEGAVSLMTSHACKGLEFPITFVLGMEEGNMPHGRALSEAENTDEALEEERRIAYVALTRAKKKLFVSFCKARQQRGRDGQMSWKKTFPSRFLLEGEFMDQDDYQYHTEEWGGS